MRLADLGRPLHDTLCLHASLAEAALATLSWDVLLANTGCRRPLIEVTDELLESIGFTLGLARDLIGCSVFEHHVDFVGISRNLLCRLKRSAHSQ